MTATELDALVHAPRMALPPAGWTEPLVRRYVSALVRHIEAQVRDGTYPTPALLDRIERLLMIREGVR